MPGLMPGAQEPQDQQQGRYKDSVVLILESQIAHRIAGAGEKKQGHAGQDGARQGIKGQPGQRVHGHGFRQEHETQDRVGQSDRGQEQWAALPVWPKRGQRGPEQRDDDEQVCVHSCSAVSLRVSRESKALWMRSTMMPMTKMPTVTSSRMPNSTRIGVDLTSSRPAR